MSIGDRLKACYKKRSKDLGLTRKDIDTALKLGKNTLDRYFSGENVPSAQFVADYCDLLNVRADYILSGSEPMERDHELPVLDRKLEAGQLLRLQDTITKMLREKLDSSV